MKTKKKAKQKTKLTFRNHTIVRSPLEPFFSTPMAVLSALVTLFADEDEGMEVEKAVTVARRCRCQGADAGGCFLVLCDESEDAAAKPKDG